MHQNENASNAGRHEANSETTCNLNINEYQAINQADLMPLLDEAAIAEKCSPSI